MEYAARWHTPQLLYAIENGSLSLYAPSSDQRISMESLHEMERRVNHRASVQFLICVSALVLSIAWMSNHWTLIFVAVSVAGLVGLFFPGVPL
jgi:hypothetical protein